MFDQIMKKFNKRKNLQSIKTDIPIFNVLSFDMITMVKLDFISLVCQFVHSSRQLYQIVNHHLLVYTMEEH